MMRRLSVTQSCISSLCMYTTRRLNNSLNVDMVAIGSMCTFSGPPADILRWDGHHNVHSGWSCVVVAILATCK